MSGASGVKLGREAEIAPGLVGGLEVVPREMINDSLCPQKICLGSGC